MPNEIERHLRALLVRLSEELTEAPPDFVVVQVGNRVADGAGSAVAPLAAFDFMPVADVPRCERALLSGDDALPI